MVIKVVSALCSTDPSREQENLVVKLGFRSKLYLKSLRDLDLELVAVATIAMSPPIKLF